VGTVAHVIAPAWASHPEVFAVLGMGALLTSIVRAPLTGIVLMIELTGKYDYMLPLLVSCFAAYGVAGYAEMAGWGAWRRSGEVDASLRPLPLAVLVYLTALGLYLFYRGVMHRHTERRPRVVAPLGLVGGFLDAAGGGGWGGIVTSNLLVQGSNPRKTIGTVNTAEFFLTVTISATFLATLGWQAFTTATVGLLIGGVCAAPFGAWIAKRVNPDTLLTFVGALLTLVSCYGLYRALA